MIHERDLLLRTAAALNMNLSDVPGDEKWFWQEAGDRGPGLYRFVKDDLWYWNPLRDDRNTDVLIFLLRIKVHETPVEIVASRTRKDGEKIKATVPIIGLKSEARQLAITRCAAGDSDA